MLCYVMLCYEIKAKFGDNVGRFGWSAQLEVKLQRSVQGSPLGNVALPGADRHSAGSSGTFLPVSVYLWVHQVQLEHDLTLTISKHEGIYFTDIGLIWVFILNARPVLATHCFSWPFLPAINLAGCICWVHFIPVRLIGGRPPGYSQSPKISSKCL